MIERGFGRIVFITSNTVWRPPVPDLLPYVVSKAALAGIARSLAKPLGAHGITVNCVAPGLTRTVHRRGPSGRGVRGGARSQALPRSLMPDDTAAVVAFLATDAAAAISGQTLSADGGSVFA
jgi:NAD(P)-dependent dehydrogenase (short-subunit alcohol dehydrogenase family)